MQSFEIRETFLSFFESKGHRRYDSIPLIPNDPTMLLTIAGMVPFKAWMSGDAVPEVPRATSFQKCARTLDIENVGVTTRHFTLFEMLGNFSFGDYFKREAIEWAWELCTGPLGLDPERIWATVYEEDSESADIWEEVTDIPRSRIQALGKEDNFWSTGAAGPCGPCSELHYDRGPDFGEGGGPAVNGERFLEFYNLVFMQFLRDDPGKILGDLPQQNVDTGMGLERMAMLKQNVPNAFEIDIVKPLVDLAAEVTGTAYGAAEKSDISLRVIAEHARSTAMLIADGVLPSKEGRGYILRRLLRRAVRHAHLLGATDAIMPAMLETAIDTMAPGYPELHQQRDLVMRVGVAEEKGFRKTLGSGLEMVESEVAAASKTFSGDVAFKLHDTHGFPIDLTQELADEAGLALDRDRFDELMTEQRERARANIKRGGSDIGVEQYREAAALASSDRATEFTGYKNLEEETALTALLVPGGTLEAAEEGDEFELIMPRTPFYREGGGQVGDRGVIETDTGRIEVLDTVEAIEGVTTHKVRVISGEIARGQEAVARVDQALRQATARSHSATHVLHATIREMLGDHAQQAGSLVEPGRLRFDFPHTESVSDARLRDIEQTINERVVANPHVETEIMSIDDAKKSGATANFGDKYGSTVRVVQIGDFSRELCGGTHVADGAVIGQILITKEESIGANTRRIEALTGMDAYRQAAMHRHIVHELTRSMTTTPDDLIDRIASLTARVKAADKELAQLRTKELVAQAAALAERPETVEGGSLVVARIDNATSDDLRTVIGTVRGRLDGPAVVILGSGSDDGKATLLAGLLGDAADRGTARDVLADAAKAVGGGAGGKGDMAQAGGKDASKLDEALKLATEAARTLLATA